MTKHGFAALLFAVSALAGCNRSTAPSPEMQALADRIAIEDMLVDYYANFGGTENEDFASYYTEDAVFDVNGQVAEGRDAIVKVYDGLGGDGEANEAPAAQPVFHMILSNPQIDIDGDIATVKLFWTGVDNADPFGPPTIREQGREYDKLVKQDGKWLIQHRVVIADSGMPEVFRGTWQPRLDYDIATAEKAVK